MRISRSPFKNPQRKNPTASGKRIRLCLAAGLLLSVSACLQKEKAKTAISWLPAWDSIAYAPSRLTDFHYAGPESLFAIFDTMEAADSIIQAAGNTVFPKNPEDTLRIRDLFDTGFVFPADPEAVMPYAFDGEYRDDTLFRKAYGNGLFEQEHPCVESWVISGDFPHPAEWLSAGLSEDDIDSSLGTPFLRHPLQMRYRWQGKEAVDSTGGDSTVRYESMRFYFKDDSLYAVLLQRSKPCF